MITRTLWVAACILGCAALSACDGTRTNGDAGTMDQDAGARDAGTPGEDAGPDAGAPDAGSDEDAGTPPTCTESGFEPSSVEGYHDSTVVSYSALNEDFDELLIELFFDLGATEGPHTFEFDGESYATCHTCSLLLEDCETGACGEFQAVSGRMRFTELTRTGRMAGTLTDVVYREVTIDRDTHESTVIPGGRVWCVPSMSFSVDP